MCNADVSNYEQTTLFPLKESTVCAYNAFNVLFSCSQPAYCHGIWGGKSKKTSKFQINHEMRDIKKDWFFLNLLDFSERQHCELQSSLVVSWMNSNEHNHTHSFHPSLAFLCIPFHILKCSQGLVLQSAEVGLMVIINYDCSIILCFLQVIKNT